MTKKSCDVLVIGSGLGGLCAAALLANEGFNTIVTEIMLSRPQRTSSRI